MSPEVIIDGLKARYTAIFPGVVCGFQCAGVSVCLAGVSVPVFRAGVRGVRRIFPGVSPGLSAGADSNINCQHLNSGS